MITTIRSVSPHLDDRPLQTEVILSRFHGSITCLMLKQGDAESGPTCALLGYGEAGKQILAELSQSKVLAPSRANPILFALSHLHRHFSPSPHRCGHLPGQSSLRCGAGCRTCGCRWSWRRMRIRPQKCARTSRLGVWMHRCEREGRNGRGSELRNGGRVENGRGEGMREATSFREGGGRSAREI